MKSQPHIHIHINQLIGEVHLPSKEDAENFMEKLSKTLQRVITDTQYALEPNPNQGQES